MISRDFDIVQGDDYAVADGRALVFTGAGQNWPDLSAATVELAVSVTNIEGVIFSAAATRSVVAGLQYFTVPLTAAQTTQLPSGTNSCEYALRATLGGRRLTLAAANFNVRGDIL